MYYAVKKGLVPGIYNTWDECKENVEGFSGAVFKKFKTYAEAEKFLNIESFDKTQFNKYIDVKKPAEKHIIAYVDGSFDNKDDSYSYGGVLIFNDKIVEISKRFKKSTYSAHRNVSGEIMGSVFAIQYALENEANSIKIYYDYKGIEEWAKGRWKTNTELTKKYKKFMDEASKKIDIQFEKVLAHSGDFLNDCADSLAKNADFGETKISIIK
ncbi:MAG: ribonuclease H family protein [Tissierellia bacterium]|nr:ribonuclease H family protein [Tissierellia bacterium]